MARSSALPPTRTVDRFRRVFTPLWLFVGLAASLEVPSRRGGPARRVTVIPVKVEGRWYVLGFGGVTEWARDLRAAGRATLRRRGRQHLVTAAEVDGNERDRVIAAYFARGGPKFIRGDFDRRPSAADHPAFRLDPIG